MDSKKTVKLDEPKQKKTYIKPEIQSEAMMGFGAVCNGTTISGRKDTTGAPNFCNASRLMS